MSCLHGPPRRGGLGPHPGHGLIEVSAGAARRRRRRLLLRQAATRRETLAHASKHLLSSLSGSRGATSTGIAVTRAVPVIDVDVSTALGKLIPPAPAGRHPNPRR